MHSKIHKLLIISAIVFFVTEPKCSLSQIVNSNIEYYSNGQALKRAKFKDNKPHGIWIHYYFNGNIKLKEKWEHGSLLWQIKYDNNKRKIYGVNAAGDTTFYKGCNCAN
jgi:antitoxin component YwqK of YwqJK toxin-antitoxin module